MKVSIDGISEYGRFYSDLEEHTEWWFCIADYKTYDVEEMAERFAYYDKETIVAAGGFIPLFQTDIIALEKEFLTEFAFNGGFSCDNPSEFDLRFKIYIELNFLEREWYAFEKKRLCEDAVKWCKENHIPYCKDNK